MDRVRNPERGRTAVRFRRILLVAARPGEGRLTGAIPLKKSVFE